MVTVLLLALMQAPSSPIKTIERGAMSYVEDRRELVVRTPAEWTMFWRGHSPDRALPAVDFSQAMVVGIFLGSRPTAGYSVEIVRTLVRDGALVVQYVEKSPGRGDVTAQMVTMPYHLAAVPKHAG